MSVLNLIIFIHITIVQPTPKFHMPTRPNYSNNMTSLFQKAGQLQVISTLRFKE